MTTHHDNCASSTSRVVLACGETILRSYPANALIRLLLPAFTGPSKTTRHGCVNANQLGHVLNDNDGFCHGKLILTSRSCIEHLLNLFYIFLKGSRELPCKYLSCVPSINLSQLFSNPRCLLSFSAASQASHETSSAPADTKLLIKDRTTHTSMRMDFHL